MSQTTEFAFDRKETKLGKGENARIFAFSQNAYNGKKNLFPQGC